MEGVERTNIVVVRNPLQGQEEKGGEMRKYSYIMNVDRERNYYSYREFGHLARNCRS